MALEMIFRWQAPDSTEYYNRRLKDILPWGVWRGAEVVPGTGLNVEVQPFVCATQSGETVREDTDTHAVAVPDDNVEYYIGLLAKYVPLGAPVVQLTKIETSVYPTWVDKEFFIRFATVQVPASTVQITAPMIENCSKDVAIFDSRIELVTDPASLPTLDCNDVGTVYFSKSNRQYYVWDGSAWLAGLSDILAGEDTFSGVAGGGSQTVMHPGGALGTTAYRVLISPSEDTDDDFGEFWVEKQNDRFLIHRGGGYTGTFDWMIVLA